MAPTPPGEGTEAGGEGSEVSLDLRAEFYPPEAVARAAAEYQAVAEIALERRGPYTRVLVRARAGADATRIGHELANWALAAAAVASDP